MSTQLPEFVYSCVEDWVLNLLAPTIERRLDTAGASTLTWCPEWWRHAEAIARLEALWRAWEVCRDADGEAPSRWFWQHCDPMLAVLMDAKSGPLTNCKRSEHGKYDTARALPSTPAPAGYWGSDVAAIAWPGRPTAMLPEDCSREILGRVRLRQALPSAG